jgi:hypothetical protein
MIEGFDKEIDAILRKARGVETVGIFDTHLDAEDISAFAENILPPKIRQIYTAHLANCNRCRQILANVITLNSAEVKTVSSVVAPQIVAETSIPWYRRLFAMPNLAYTTGALVLVFGGFLGFMVLQNFDNSIGEVSSVADKSIPQTAPEFPSETNSAKANSGSTTANTSTNSGTTSATAKTNTAPIISSNSTTNRASSISSEPNSEVLATPQIQTAEKQENKERDKQKAETQDLARTIPAPTINQPTTSGEVRENSQPQDDKDAYSADSQVRNEEEAKKPKTTRAVPQMSRKSNSSAETARQVGGKTFKKIGGTWFDSDYGTQKQISVRRGSNEYKNLDFGLRSIADQFSETVVILWKSKAYRIQ